MVLPFSIIIPTRNRPRALQDTLDHLRTVDYPSDSYEVTVVDNAPDDDSTRQVVRKARTTWKNVRYARIPLRGASGARNEGVRVSLHKHLLFIDDDVRVNSAFLQGWQKAWKAHRTARMIGGKVIAQLESGKPLTPEQTQLLEEYAWCFAHQDPGRSAAKDHPGDFLLSANLSYRRTGNEHDIFSTKVGNVLAGNIQLNAEDFELSIRKILEGEKVWYVNDDATTVLHQISERRFTPEYIHQRHFISGIEIAITEKCIREKFPQISLTALGVPGFESMKSLTFWKHFLTDKNKRARYISYQINKGVFGS